MIAGWKSQLLLFALLVGHSGQVAAADRLTLLEGETLTAEVAAISAQGELSGPNVPSGLVIDALRRIDRSPESQIPSRKILLDLAGGGIAFAESLTIKDEKFVLKGALGDGWTLPLEAVRSVRFKPDVKDDSFEAALAKPSAENDRLFVEVEGQRQMLTGLIESLTAESVTFQYEGQSQSLPTERLFGIVVANVAGGGKFSSGVTVEMADGSRFSGTAKSLAEGKFTLALNATSELSLPWPLVKSVTVRSSRLAYLSDLEPSLVEERTIVTPAQPFQRDRSVAKKPLQVAGKKFDKGLGVHAASQLAFDLAGRYDGFSVVIGLDAVAEGKGDCVFVVTGDGQELARERITGHTSKELKLSVKGVKTLTLIVEAGEKLDLGDAADWADARVIRQP